MPRVLHISSSVLWCLFFVVGFCSFRIVTVHADCWYDEERHEEGAEVATAEPCLNCTCSRGVLLCYLRVCPKLPNPPPPGCILLHRYRTCCPELICAEFSGGGNGLEARSEPDDDMDIPFDRTVLKNACISNGSVYGPGSAMDSSSFCEYCYCLGGKQTCVKPKCLLPIEGCTPLYEPTNCCPVHYNCTHLTTLSTTSSSTTTGSPNALEEKGGCIIDGFSHPEGGKVLGMGHSVCDNCYCLKGVLRCEPLSCAPPLLGCTPVIKSGECCAASYNCSGTIEIQPEPNYGHFPIVSKEYAKLRKEVNQKRPQSTQGVVTVAPSYIFPETPQSLTTKQRSTGTFGTTRHFAGISFIPSTTKPFFYDSVAREDHKQSTRSYLANTGIDYATTNYEIQNRNYKRVLSTTNKPKPTAESSTLKLVNPVTTTSYKDDDKSPGYLESFGQNIFSLFESLLSESTEINVNNATNATDIDTTDSITTTTDTIPETTTIEVTTGLLFEENSTEADSTSHQITEDDNSTTTEIISTTTYESPSYPLTVKSVLNSTDCTSDKDSLEPPESNEIESTTVISVDAKDVNGLVEVRKTSLEDNVGTTEAVDASRTTTEEFTVKYLKTATLRNIPDLNSDLESILNITKHKDEEYQYDYNEPSLPPSLPNLKIIPFVAEDALDSKKDDVSKEEEVYPQKKVAGTGFAYTNLFSPPAETEGGFVPKDPPTLDNYYEKSATAGQTKQNANCINQDGREVVHGQSVASSSPCITCTCFYGNIVCQKPTCPIPRPGCRKSTVQDLTLCCPVYVCDDQEAPTVVLDRIDGTSNQEDVTVAERVVTPDPFRDVIRTEPAPNLQSLIIDMMPLLARKTTPYSQVTKKRQSTTSMPKVTTQKPVVQTDEEEFSLDKVFQFIFSDEKPENFQTTTGQIQTELVHKTADEPSPIETTLPPSTTQKPNLPEPTIVTLEDRIGTESNHPNNVDSSTGMALLINLAGCNIYGRMYRVGRIISELSGPCLECKCTEIGVQCKPLRC